MNYKDDKAFMAAWAKMEVIGYRYGDDAMENVYTGWLLQSNVVLKIQNDYDADMETAKQNLQKMAQELRKSGERRLDLLKKNLGLENLLQRAFSAHPNLDLDIENID